ncbi:hypothetical protein XENORESO_018732 [Xenotaenia resolanae]|uniref:Uncharacterized protein n=1 Tax=Xenotaenia resolanae TaxID=208358 RepID=A0ABV0WZA1_9TELE
MFPDFRSFRFIFPTKTGRSCWLVGPSAWRWNRVLGTSHPEPVLLGHRRLVRAHRGKEGSGAAIRTASDTWRKMFGLVDGSWNFWSTRSDRGFISSMKFIHLSFLLQCDPGQSVMKMFGPENIQMNP